MGNNRNFKLNQQILQYRATALKTAAICVLMLAVFLPARYVNSIYGYLPGLGVLSLLLLSQVYFFIMRRSVRFEADTSETACLRGETVNAVLKIANRSVLTCPKARAYLTVSGFHGVEDSTAPMNFAMDGKSETVFPVHIKMDHIGVYLFGVKLLRIYDPLGIFSITVRETKSFRVTVLPKLFPAEDIRLEEKQLTESRNLSKSAVSDGFDYTGVREYALGDSMKRVHWKLSAHSSAYMTRTTESSRKNDLTVLIDFVPGSFDGKVRPHVYDCLVETALSLMAQAMSKDVEYSLLFFGRDGELCRVTPKGEQDYEGLIQMLPAFRRGMDPEFADGAEILEMESRLSNRGSNIILCTARVTEGLLKELTEVKKQQRNPELYYVLPPSQQNAGTEIRTAMLGVLEESGIRYHLIKAEEG